MLSQQRTGGGGLLRTSTVSTPGRERRMLPSTGPVTAIFYMWVGGFWIWPLVDVLSAQYPALFAALIH